MRVAVLNVKTSLVKDVIPKIPVINDFIESELERLEDYRDVPEREAEDMQSLNSLFKATLSKNFHNG